jgi:hypothetical protein
MFIPNKDEVKLPKKGSVALYLDKLTDKLLVRESVKVHVGDIERPIKSGGLGWNISSIHNSVRDGDTSYDWKATGLEVCSDNQSIADRLQREAVERGYGMVFYADKNTIYAARNWPE